MTQYSQLFHLILLLPVAKEIEQRHRYPARSQWDWFKGQQSLVGPGEQLQVLDLKTSVRFQRRSLKIKQKFNSGNKWSFQDQECRCNYEGTRSPLRVQGCCFFSPFFFSLSPSPREFSLQVHVLGCVGVGGFGNDDLMAGLFVQSVDIPAERSNR